MKGSAIKMLTKSSIPPMPSLPNSKIKETR